MTLDDLVSPYRDDDDDRRSTYRRRSSMVRNALPLSRFWSPSDALSRQPWYGFPGGREGWLEWKQTGQVPLQAGEDRSRQLTPEQQDFYYRMPDAEPQGQPAYNYGQDVHVAGDSHSRGGTVGYIPSQPGSAGGGPLTQSGGLTYGKRRY